MEETQESGEHTLRRTLGPIHLTALGIGAIIGAGIFVLSGLGAHYAGPGLMLSFVLSSARYHHVIVRVTSPATAIVARPPTASFVTTQRDLETPWVQASR